VPYQAGSASFESHYIIASRRDPRLNAKKSHITK
jgi:hypothetical protein